MKDAILRQPVLADPPAPELAPVEDRNGRNKDRRDVFRPYAADYPHRGLRRHPSTILEEAGATADTPATQYRLVGGIDRNPGRLGNQGEGVEHVQSLGEFLLRITDIEDDGIRRRVLNCGYQFVGFIVGQRFELHPGFKFLELLQNLSFESLIMLPSSR